MELAQRNKRKGEINALTTKSTKQKKRKKYFKEDTKMPAKQSLDCNY